MDLIWKGLGYDTEEEIAAKAAQKKKAKANDDVLNSNSEFARKLLAALAEGEETKKYDGLVFLRKEIANAIGYYRIGDDNLKRLNLTSEEIQKLDIGPNLERHPLWINTLKWLDKTLNGMHEKVGVKKREKKDFYSAADVLTARLADAKRRAADDASGIVRSAAEVVRMAEVESNTVEGLVKEPWAILNDYRSSSRVGKTSGDTAVGGRKSRRKSRRKTRRKSRRKTRRKNKKKKSRRKSRK